MDYNKSAVLKNRCPCPLPDCGSSNAVTRYADGSAFCFSCHKQIPIDKTKIFSATNIAELKGMADCFQVLRLEARNISQETCAFYGYLQGWYNNQAAHAAVYRTPKGEICAHKYRLANKDFSWLGNSQRAGLFGQHLFNPNPKIAVVVTEGEIDALSIAELQNCKWPVVSIRNGAGSAHKDLAQQIEWLSGWKHVILCFDNDEAGKKAIENCVPLFESGKVKVTALPLKDANEMLVAGRYKELEQALWSAQVYRPDYIQRSSEVTLKQLQVLPPVGFSMPYPHLEYMMRGIPKGKMLLIASGVGMGKTSIAKEIAYHLVIHHGCKIGNIFLEESQAETQTRYIALDNNIAFADLCYPEELTICDTMSHEVKAWRKQFNIETKQKQINWQPKEISEQQWEASYARLFSEDKLIFFNHEGCKTLENILARINYLAVSEQCDFIILDNVTSLVSGLIDKQNNCEVIDTLMRELESIKLRTNVGFIIVTQLSKDAKKASYNEGGRVTMADFRGSVQLGAVPDAIVGLEGNQQDESTKLLRQLRVLKARAGAKTGLAGTLLYNEQTGRLLPVLQTPQTSRNSFE